MWKKFFQYDRVSLTSIQLQCEFETVFNVGKNLSESVHFYQAVLSQICIICKYLRINRTFMIKSLFLATNP